MVIFAFSYIFFSFNQFDLPEYATKEILFDRVMLAIKETKGFGFA